MIPSERLLGAIGCFVIVHQQRSCPIVMTGGRHDSRIPAVSNYLVSALLASGNNLRRIHQAHHLLWGPIRVGYSHPTLRHKEQKRSSSSGVRSEPSSRPIPCAQASSLSIEAIARFKRLALLLKYSEYTTGPARSGNGPRRTLGRRSARRPHPHMLA